ncbi:lamin tail domain-containing protein [Nitrosopumilus sp.]|uniref:lamin tail domain-containing protein n=1 Tax=Nitrosopumilus sp. TaxID=2024843 RepID=UPI00247C0275|nr:lamin tail domain-containing protein [Nitrosopumilus sp.]MCV0431628.1 lamin tail domain-containing protein [Nitrosopumilus sp.]
MNRNIPIIFSVLLFAGILAPAYAQTSDHVVINEVDINPPGDDSKTISEWIELYNPTDSDVDIGGWKIASTTVLKKTMIISSGTIIKPGQYLTYSYQSLWFTDSNESVELRDGNNIVVDKTPNFSDIQNDFTSWQRLYDGYDSDSFGDWKFVTSTAGSSNGKLIQTKDSDTVTVSISSDKSSYLFGEVAVISGSVSEEVFQFKPFFQPEKIAITISGPNFNKVVTMYPDLKLNYKTTLSLHQVLGINEGNYEAVVSYGGSTSSTTFSVGNKILEQENKEESDISILTNKSQYLPGENVSISGFASEIIPFEGMSFTVTDANGKIVANGNLFPTNGKFSTSIYLTTVSPNYGVYEIKATYFDKSASSTFEVIQDVKEDVPISLWTDKTAYGLGEVVTISGRLNDVWISNLDLEIVQTKQSSLSTSGNSGFKILDSVKIEGNGSFTYSFKIPDNSIRLGDYKITVSKDIGSATIIAHAVKDPENFIPSNDPLTIQTDAGIYEFSDKITISGFVKDPFSNSSYGTGTPVKVSISHEDGSPLQIVDLQETKRLGGGGVINYDFTAIPETSGRYSVQVDATKNIFDVGNYVVKAQYLSHTITTTFSIVDSLDLEDGAILSIDKDVYGLGETVHLTGILPPTGDHSVSISVTKPDGTRSQSGATVENQRFSWEWKVPSFEKPPILKNADGRDTRISNYGIYKIKVSIPSETMNIFFKVSKDPDNDTLSMTPLFVSTEKSLYKAGEKLKVIGNVIQRNQGEEGLVVKDRVQLRILDGTFPYKLIHEANVYPNQGGEFSSLFELPATVFDEGEYTVRANYGSTQTESIFSVANDFVFGVQDDLALLLNIDKSEYYPGDTVIISGKPNKLIYLEKFDVGVIKKGESEINCGSFICGKNIGPVKTIRPGPSGAFTHEYVIPNKSTSIGTYEVTVDADFDTGSVKFVVLEKPSAPKLDTIIQKENRIAEKTIPIFTQEKTVDDVTIAPRVLSGSLITPTRGDESNVDLKVTTVTGTCIIGPDAECLVRESTRKPGQIYDVVEVDGINLNVRYSGPDVRLEKFSILPETSGAFLPDANWNVEVLKDEQVSRFYYKVTYKTLE